MRWPAPARRWTWRPPLWVESLDLAARPDADTVELEMVCGKGGYVRSIARDLGQALGVSWPCSLAAPGMVGAVRGLPVVFGRDDVSYVKCSDEHGVVEDPQGVLAVGDMLRLVPGHCDPTCNVHDWYVGVRGGVVESVWPVSARGKAY